MPTTRPTPADQDCSVCAYFPGLIHSCQQAAYHFFHTDERRWVATDDESEAWANAERSFQLEKASPEDWARWGLTAFDHSRCPADWSCVESSLMIIMLQECHRILGMPMTGGAS